MSIQLSPELQLLADRKVAEEGYASPGEVVAEALRLLEKRDRVQQARREELRAALALGVADLERGDYVLLDDHEVRRLNEERRAHRPFN